MRTMSAVVHGVVVPGVLVYPVVVRTLVPPRGMGPGTLLVGPQTRIWEKPRETKKSRKFQEIQ